MLNRTLTEVLTLEKQKDELSLRVEGLTIYLLPVDREHILLTSSWATAAS